MRRRLVLVLVLVLAGRVLERIVEEEGVDPSRVRHGGRRGRLRGRWRRGQVVVVEGRRRRRRWWWWVAIQMLLRLLGLV